MGKGLMVLVVSIIGLAAGISWVLTPAIRLLALRFQIVEKPSKRRIEREQRTPLLGGVAIFLSFWITTGYLYLNGCDLTGLTSVQWAGLFLGSSILFLTGILDDVTEIKAVIKLAFQVISVGILVCFGFRITQLYFPLIGLVQLGVFSIPLSLFWGLFLINAVNLLDGLDGLASGIASVIALIILWVAWENGQILTVYLAGCLVGACIGFLRFNFYPAGIFMGDTGSMFLGYMLTVISFLSGHKSSISFSLFVPVMIMAVPIIDTSFAIVRRVMHKKPIFSPDDNHVHHRLYRGVFRCQRRTVYTMYALTLCYGFIGVAFADPTFRGPVAFVAVVFTVLLTIRWFRNLVILPHWQQVNGHQGDGQDRE